MIGTGKYNFPGIRKAGAVAIKAALASSVVGGLLKGPFGGTLNLLLEWAMEWLANRGVILLNIGAFKVNGHFDQQAFDKAMDAGLSQVESGEAISLEEMRVIDEKVKEAMRRFVPYNRP